MVFVDTPGYHHSAKSFNLHLKGVAESALSGIDLILYLLDTTRLPGPEEEDLVNLLSAYKIPLVVGLNKNDHPGSREEKMREWIGRYFPDAPVHSLSALKKEGIEGLLNTLFDEAPEGEGLYPDDLYTDQEPEFRIREIIREKAITKAQDELPHALYVEVADMEKTEMDEARSSLWVRAFLMVEQDSQKGILVGKGGRIIKEIRLAAQKELNEIFPYRVNLDLMVKVKKKWRKNQGFAAGDAALRLSGILLLLFIIPAGIFVFPASDPPELRCQAAILYDLETGQVLYEKNADAVIPPASLTKLMSLHLAYEAVAAGRLAKDQLIPIGSESSFKASPPHSSLMFLERGQRVTLLELMKGLALSSGNDAGVALARAVADSMAAFVDMMNSESLRLGLEKTRFVDSSGYSAKNRTTPREFAAFCRFYIERHPEALEELHSLDEFTFPSGGESSPGRFQHLRPHHPVQPQHPGGKPGGGGWSKNRLYRRSGV